MKTLLATACLAAGAAWLCWELLPFRYSYFSPPHDQPYLVFVIQSLIGLSIASFLLLIVVAIQRPLRAVIVPWFRSAIVRAQLAVCAGAAVTGVYAVAQLLQMRAQLHREWGAGDSFWLFIGPVAAVAWSPWLVFAAAAVLASVATSIGRAQAIGVVVFDLLATAFLAFVFAHVFHWACLSCSGPAG